LKIYSLFIEYFPRILFFRYFLFCSMLSYSVRFQSAEGMVVISVKDMLTLSSERVEKSLERFVYVVSRHETFTFVLLIEKRTAWTKYLLFLNYGNSQSLHEDNRLCRIFVSSVCVNNLKLPSSLEFVRFDDWANSISFKLTKKVCLFNSVKKKKWSSSRHIQQFQSQKPGSDFNNRV
jgi:hypothetical protein